MGSSGHEIKGVANHFGGFRAWIPERSDFFKGPKGPKGPERSDFFQGPKGPKGPLGPERSDFFKPAGIVLTAEQVVTKDSIGLGSDVIGH